jgi:hypothetical protein
MLVKAEARKEESSYDPSLMAMEGSAGDVKAEPDGAGIVILKRRASMRDLRIREPMLPLAPTRATF